MNNAYHELLIAFLAVYDELTAERPCGVCDDCPVLDSLADAVTKMRESVGTQFTGDLDMKPVDWSKCSRVKHIR